MEFSTSKSVALDSVELEHLLNNIFALQFWGQRQICASEGVANDTCRKHTIGCQRRTFFGHNGCVNECKLHLTSSGVCVQCMAAGMSRKGASSHTTSVSGNSNRNPAVLLKPFQRKNKVIVKIKRHSSSTKVQPSIRFG